MADGQTGMPWHLRGNWAPHSDEIHVSDLKVEGEIPAELSGTYIRTGPNPKSGTSDHWFLGDGMLHGLRICDGKAEWYKNAFVQTASITGNRDGIDPAQFGLHDSKANTHIVAHQGKIYGLYESGWPWEIDQDLNTLGVQNFSGALDCAMTAHPKVCPATGELLAFSYFQFEQPFLRYIRIGADGALKQVEPIEIPNMVMMHDFAITENFAIFMDMPLLFDMELLATGIPFRFDRTSGARLGVMPRAGTNADIRWFEIEPCYVFHTVNAHEDGRKIILTASRMASAFGADSNDYSEVGYLWRWTLDLDTGAVKEEQLDDRGADFGRVNDAFIGQNAKHGYLMSLAGEGNSEEPIYGNQLYKYDLASGARTTHELGGLVRGGEPVFVQTGAGEDEGYVMCLVHDEETQESKFLIINAQDFDGPPVATIHLPRRVPYGAHGSWVPLA